MQSRKRLILAMIAGTFIACAGIYWLFNRSNSDLTNFFVIIFTVLSVLFAFFQWVLPQSPENDHASVSTAQMRKSHATFSSRPSPTRQLRERPQRIEPIAWYEWVQIVLVTLFVVFNSFEKMLLYPMIGLIPAAFLYLILVIARVNQTSPLAGILFLSVFISACLVSFLADFVSTMKSIVGRVKTEKWQVRVQHVSYK